MLNRTQLKSSSDAALYCCLFDVKTVFCYVLSLKQKKSVESGPFADGRGLSTHSDPLGYGPDWAIPLPMPDASII